MSVPTIALVGYGRSGKDTAGAWLGQHTPLRYVGSTSQVVCPLIAKELGLTEQEAWDQRHQCRLFWKDWCDRYRLDDPTKLARACLAHGDMVVGLRDKLELAACQQAGLFDQVIWVHRDVPVDPTVTFGPEDADIVIYNTADLIDFYRKLARWARFASLPVWSDA